jgi:GNAT superfamily N-acetyltransferase
VTCPRSMTASTFSWRSGSADVVAIRAASFADAARIAVVQRAGWVAAYSDIISAETIDRVTAPDDGARVRQTFQTRPWQRMIVAAEQESGQVVGYASYGPEVDVLGMQWPHPMTSAGAAGEVAELYALYVHPDWWSTGTGAALMSAVLGHTKGYPDTVLWVLERNARARAFYERFGFCADGAVHVLDGLGGVPEVRYRRPPPAPLSAPVPDASAPSTH